MVLNEEERAVVKDALFRQAEFYTEQARQWLKFNGDPVKGFDGLIDHYFSKSKILTNVAEKIVQEK